MGPLSGLKILDFSKLLPGPFGTMMLADMGAEVLRVEWPDKPDMARQIPPFIGGVSTTHSFLNRSKKSISLDLKSPKAVELIKKLVESYDIVVEQFRPGVMDALGIGYEDLRVVQPKLIYCSITGYGQTGPLRDRAGHDINYLALSGLASYSGRKEAGPSLAGTQVADIAGGTYPAVMAILAAVIHRQSTAEGQAIDISIADGAMALNAMSGAASTMALQETGYEEHLLNGGGFYDYYRTGDDRYLSVGALEPKFLKALLTVIGRMDLVPLAASSREDDRKMFKDQLREIFSSRPLADWQEVFTGVDACVEPVLTLKEAIDHPHFVERGMLVEIKGKDGETVKQIANPIKFSKSQMQYTHTGLEIGRDNKAVFSQLGLSDDDISQLIADGVCGSHQGQGRSPFRTSEDVSL